MTRRHPAGNSFGVDKREHDAALADPDARPWTADPIDLRTPRYQANAKTSLLDEYLAKEAGQ